VSRSGLPNPLGLSSIPTVEPVVGCPRGSRLLAAIVVATVATVPTLPFLTGLGFYLDDYYFLGAMSASHDRSLPGLFEALLDADQKAWLRPAMYFGLGGLFRLFGTGALPYHLFVVALVPASAVLLYLVLDRLRAPGFLALGVPIVFAAAPHYSTDRFWLASYPAPASVALALAALYAFLSAREAHGAKLAAWLAGGGVALVLSALLYEVALPLLGVGVLALWYGVREGPRPRRLTAASASLVLLLVLVYKTLAATTLVGDSSYRVGYETGILHHLGYLFSGSIKVNFGTYGVGLPYVVGWIFVQRPTWTAVAVSLVAGGVVLAYLASGACSLELPRPGGPRTWLRLVLAGVVLIALGYASFLVTEKIYFTSAGIDNRVNIVAAMGVAVLAIGLVLRGILFLPPGRQALGFAVACAALVATGTLITSTLADYWVAASNRQDEVVARLRSIMPPSLTNTTVVLDGVCPEIGPGVVFTASYDLAGAMRIAYRDPTISAPVATQSVEAGPSALIISTVLFGNLNPHIYPYGPRLLAFDWRSGKVVTLRNAALARQYLAATPRPPCPPLRSFNWGIETSRYVPFAYSDRGASWGNASDRDHRPSRRGQVHVGSEARATPRDPGPSSRLALLGRYMDSQAARGVAGDPGSNYRG
jgi:hypothetical protein